jgi:DNA-binding SARP family transcriptional activator
MDTPWRIELLGRLRATQGDRVVTRFRARKTGALLAYLAYYRERPHPREALIELFWPETEPHSGRNNLRRELSSLRRQLEPPGYPRSEWLPTGAVLVADRATVQLNPAACTTDVIEFEAALADAARATRASERARRLSAAVDRYSGELLPGHFADWIVPERQRLAEAFFQALWQLTTHWEQDGDQEAAIVWARRSVAADPLREESHRRLMGLLAAAGQPDAVLRQYQELERLFARELGVSPTP